LSNATNAQRPKRYTLDAAALSMPGHLGTIDPSNNTRTLWDPLVAAEALAELQARPGFDADRYCARCEEYDLELAITADQKRLPRLRPEKLRQMKLNPVALPWEPAKPSCDAHLKNRHKIRPARPSTMDACHMCLLSFLDEQELPTVAPELVATLKAEFRAARDNLRRLYRARVHQGAPTLGPYLEKLLESARARLRSAVRACQDAGFEPARPRATREGDEAPGEVVATTLEFHTEPAESPDPA
jgi:hypothetical protein